MVVVVVVVELVVGRNVVGEKCSLGLTRPSRQPCK